jgi:large subunit ribosomal protein L15
VRLDLIAARFAEGEIVTVEGLKDRGLVKKVGKNGVKVLGNGDLGHALTIQAHKFTLSAVAKIEAAGGKVEELTA